MAQQEMMLRLLNKGKIAGYARLQKNNVGYFPFQTSQTIDGEFVTAKYPLEIDSIELGVKVGDEWWFEGDKGHFYEDHGHGRFIEFDFVLYWNGIIWYTEPDNPYMPQWIVECLATSKKLGTIHDSDEVKP